ncbi:MAG: TonB-dependent receptor [Bacteroidota bacterium]
MTKGNSFILAIVFTAILLSAGQFSMAQQKQDSSLMDVYLDNVVITGEFGPTDVKKAIHEIRVIKSIDIQRQGLNNLAEVLTNQLNLRVSTDPILGNGLSIQGIGGQNVQVMIDGVPVIGRLNGNVDLSQINLQNIERIEIIEGAMSAQYGSNASGGVINLISKKVQANRVEVESQNQYESVGIRNHSFSVGTRINKLYASVLASYYESRLADEDSLRVYETVELPSGDSYRARAVPWNPKVQYGLNGTLRYYISDSTKLTYQYRYFDEELSIFGEVRRPQFRPYAFDEVYSTLRQDHSLNIDSYLGNFHLNSTTAFNVFNREKQTQRLDFEPDTISLVNGGQDTSVFTALLHRSILSSQLKGKINGQLGIEALHETGSGERIIDSTTLPINQASLTNVAGWVSLRYQPTQLLTMQANLRYGYNTKYTHPLIPSFHLNWNPVQQLRLKLSYAHGFRAPTLKELHFNFIDVNHYIIGNPDLRAENSRNATLSIGYEGSFNKQHSFETSARVFYNHIRDRIVLAEFSSLQFNYQNISTYETNGLNLRFAYKWKKNLQISSGFAYTRLYNFWTEEFETNRFTPLPEWQNELSFLIPGIETRINLVHRYFGRQIRFFQVAEDQLEQGFIGDYQLMNLSLSRSFWKNRIFISAGSKNLLNTQSVPNTIPNSGAHSGGGNSLLINWGRTYFVRMNIKLSKA